jgi:hypothetical protein
MINADGSTDLFTPAVHLEQMTTDRDYWQELAGQRKEQVRTLADHKASDDGEAPFHRGISNGQLLAMDSDRRAEVIASLSLEVRRKLAHLACLGASRLIKESVRDDSHHKARRADELAELAANLLRDGGEKYLDPADPADMRTVADFLERYTAAARSEHPGERPEWSAADLRCKAEWLEQQQGSEALVEKVARFLADETWVGDKGSAHGLAVDLQAAGLLADGGSSE